MALIRTNKASGAAYEEVNNITLTPVGSGYAVSASATLSKAYSAVGLTAIDCKTANSSSGSLATSAFSVSVSGTTLTVSCTTSGVGFNPSQTSTVSIIGVI